MLLIAIVTGAVVAMSPMCKRLTQGMIRLVADQLGNQAAADQQDLKAGFLMNSYQKSGVISQATREDLLGNTTYYPYMSSKSDILQYSNLGFTKVDN